MAVNIISNACIRTSPNDISEPCAPEIESRASQTAHVALARTCTEGVVLPPLANRVSDKSPAKGQTARLDAPPETLFERQQRDFAFAKEKLESGWAYENNIPSWYQELILSPEQRLEIISMIAKDSSHSNFRNLCNMANLTSSQISGIAEKLAERKKVFRFVTPEFIPEEGTRYQLILKNKINASDYLTPAKLTKEHIIDIAAQVHDIDIDALELTEEGKIKIEYLRIIGDPKRLIGLKDIRGKPLGSLENSKKLMEWSSAYSELTSKNKDQIWPLMTDSFKPIFEKHEKELRLLIKMECMSNVVAESLKFSCKDPKFEALADLAKHFSDLGNSAQWYDLYKFIMNAFLDRSVKDPSRDKFELWYENNSNRGKSSPLEIAPKAKTCKNNSNKKDHSRDQKDPSRGSGGISPLEMTPRPNVKTSKNNNNKNDPTRDSSGISPSKMAPRPNAKTCKNNSNKKDPNRDSGGILPHLIPTAFFTALEPSAETYEKWIQPLLHHRKDLKNGKNFRLLTTFLNLIQTLGVSNQTKHLLINHLVHDCDGKGSLFERALLLSNMVILAPATLNTEEMFSTKKLKDLRTETFIAALASNKAIDKEQIDHLLSSWRDPYALITYFTKIKEVSTEAGGRLLAEHYVKWIESLLDGSFLSFRYKDNPHINELLNRGVSTDLIAKWNKEGESEKIVLDTKPFVILDSNDPQDLILLGSEGGGCQTIYGWSQSNKRALAYATDGKNRAIVIKDPITNRTIARGVFRLLWNRTTKKPALYLERTYSSYGAHRFNATIQKYAHQRGQALDVDVFTEKSKEKYLLESFGSSAPFEHSDAAGDDNGAGTFTIEHI